MTNFKFSRIMEKNTLHSRFKLRWLNTRTLILIFLGLFLSFFNGQAQVYNCNGSKQTITLPAGSYQIECWGGNGGLGNLNSGSVPNSQIDGGKGGYSTGVINVTAPITLYINIGGKGADGFLNPTAPGGYNGGGNGSAASTHRGGGGGGATHVATVSGILSSLSGNQSAVMIVAGGGGEI